MTAAHCFTSEKEHGEHFKVYIGHNSLFDSPIVRWVRWYHQHILYNDSVSLIKHDIALVRLNRRVEYTVITGGDQDIRPATLPTCYRHDYVTEKVVIAGWGSLGIAGLPYRTHDRLQKAELVVLDQHVGDCTVARKVLHICAHLPNSSMAYGDSGGPMVLKETGEVIGILSSFTGTMVNNRLVADAMSVTIAVKISSYLDWIEDTKRTYVPGDSIFDEPVHNTAPLHDITIVICVIALHSVIHHTVMITAEMRK